MCSIIIDQKTIDHDKNNLSWSKPISNELMTKILLEQGGDNKFNISEFYEKFMNDRLKENQEEEEEKKNQEKMKNMTAKQKKKFEREQKKLKKNMLKLKKNKKYKDIIDKNQKNKMNEKYKKDLEKLENIKSLCSIKYDSELNNYISIDTIGDKVNLMDTSNGRIQALTYFLEYLNDLYKKYDKCGDFLILTYLTLSHEDLNKIDSSLKNILKNKDKALKVTESIIKKKNLKLIPIQMKFLHKYLNPLNPLQKLSKKLDPWQSVVFEHMNNNKNVLVCAKTSSGKTVCTTYLAHIEKRIIYIVPTAELARQVSGMFRSQLKGKVMLISSKEEFNDSDFPQVIVSTPDAFETYFTEKGKDSIKWIKGFDYFVFDEIHNLNSIEGDALERIISLVYFADAKLIALSATIGNINELREFLKFKMKDEVELVEYNKRFIIQQKWIYNNNKLIQLHPMSAFEFDDIANKLLMNTDLSATSEDSYKLYKHIVKELPDLKKKLDPKRFFKNYKEPVFLSLDDTRLYEEHLKNEFTNLCYLAKKNNDIDKIKKLKKILNNFKPNKIDNQNEEDLYKISRILLSTDKLPAIIFTKDEESIITTFKNFINVLKKMEKEKYPFYNEDRILIKTFYDEQESLISDLEEKVDQTEEQRLQYNEKVDKIKSESLNKMKKKMTSVINRRVQNLEDDFKKKKKEIYENYDDKNEIEEKIKKEKDYKNFYIGLYTNDLSKWVSWNTIKNINEYLPHPDFTFNIKGLDMNTTRNLKKELRKEFHNIDYEHIFIQGLERGILPYFKSMNISFQRKVQKLFYGNYVNIIFSDDSLGYGIDMPIRTVVILGEMTELQRTQMSGRSGRRNRDREGHIVFINTDWKSACKGTFERIVGNKPLNNTIALPLNNQIPDYIYKSQCEKTLLQHCIKKKVENQYKKVRINSVKEGFFKNDNLHYSLITYKLRNLLGNKALSLKLFFDYVKNTDLSNNDNNLKKIFSVLCCLYDSKNDDKNILEIDEEFLELFKIYKTRNKYYNIFNLNKSNDLLLGLINNKFNCEENEIYSKIFRLEKIGNIVIKIHNELMEESAIFKDLLKNLFNKIKKIIDFYQF